jgi:hypothetical protein
MTDMDLEAIKARARAATPGPWRVGANFIDNFTPDKDEYDVVVDVWTMDPSGDAEFEMSDEDKAFIEGMDPTTTLALIERIDRLEDAWSDAAGYGEWAAFQLEELRDRLTITDDMVDAAVMGWARETWTEAEGGWDERGWTEASEAVKDVHRRRFRAALEAALKEDQ